jgi:hypothetical protein
MWEVEWEDCSLTLALGKGARLYLKNNYSKKGWGVAEVQGPKFKCQYPQKKKREKKKRLITERYLLLWIRKKCSIIIYVFLICSCKSSEVSF